MDEVFAVVETESWLEWVQEPTNRRRVNGDAEDRNNFPKVQL